jgi:hypothetical protein
VRGYQAIFVELKEDDEKAKEKKALKRYLI